MEIKEAIKALSDGHTIWKPEYAKEVCSALGVEYSTKLEQRFKSDRPGTPKGLTMNKGNENSLGVYSLSLSQFVADKLGVADKAGDFYGRGSQARAYAEQVRAALSVKE